MPSTLRTLLAALLLLPVLAACGEWNGPRFRAETTMTRSVDHIAGSALEIKTGNGRIEVVAEPERRDVSIEARLVARGRTQEEADERLAAATLSISRDADQRLVIKPVFPSKAFDGNNDGASFTVHVPDANGVNLDTSNGRVVARGLTGDLRIDTSNGSIEVTGHQGPAAIDTSNGGVTVTDHVGHLSIDTSNGGIRLENVDGAVTADTSNGSIVAVLATGQAGPLHLDSSNGSIKVSVGPAFRGTVNLGTSNGSITVNDHAGVIRSQTIQRHKGRVVVGEGGEPSRLDTSNGRITLTIEG